MTMPLFTSNDTEITRLEGLYIKERNPPASIQGVATGMVGIFGKTLKGPVGKVVEISSESRFLEVFGGRDKGDGTLANDVWVSILNKPFGKLAIVRVLDPTAVAASFTLETLANGSGTAVVRLDATSAGTWGNTVKFAVVDASDANVNHWNLQIKDTITGKITIYKNLDTTALKDNLAATIGTDDGNPIVATKLADGRPINTSGITGADADGYLSLGQVVASFTSVVGTDGSTAEDDYYGAGKGLDLLKAYKGVGFIVCAEYMHANIAAAMATAAAATSDRLFIAGNLLAADDVATAVSAVASYRSDRIVYCYGHAYTLDPQGSGAEILTRPESWMAAVLSQTDVDIHPGEEDTKPILRGITRLYNASIPRADYITLREAGICAMESDLGSPVFVSGVTTSLTSGKTEITRRRMADYLQLSVANTLRYSVKKKNTRERRLANVGMIKAFLGGLKKAGRIVEDYQVDGEILNTEVARSQGIERILMRVKLIGHMLFLVLETEIGTGVTIQVQ